MDGHNLPPAQWRSAHQGGVVGDEGGGGEGGEGGGGGVGGQPLQLTVTHQRVQGYKELRLRSLKQYI